MPTKEDIFETVKLCLVEALSVDEDEVTPEASLTRDLGAESLDFLDINYQMEQLFGMRMARHFFLEHAEEMFGEGSAIDDSGRLTPPAMALLRERYGEATLPSTGDGLDLDEVPALITVQAVVDTILAILATLPERCPCGASAWRTENGTRIVCETCGEGAPFSTGDELTKQWLARAGPAAGLGRP